MVPMPKLSRRIVKIRGFISKGRNLTNMFGVWAQELSLADLTSIREWCRGSTRSFDLLGEGSSPFFLRSRRDSNPHDSLYQSDPIKFRHNSIRHGGEGHRMRWREKDVK